MQDHEGVENDRPRASTTKENIHVIRDLEDDRFLTVPEPLAEVSPS